MLERYCKCGCGRRIPHYKVRRGQVFYNCFCSNNFNSKKNKKYKQKTNTDFYKGGKKYCKNYNDDLLRCVICYERRDLDGMEKDCSL